MGSVMVNGVRMDHVRRCHCGRKPTIRTGYEGFDDGTGPFIILCDHGIPLADQPTDCLHLTLSRSWTKTRATTNWNRLIREHHHD